MASLLWTVLLICVAAPYALGAAVTESCSSDPKDCDQDLVCDAGTCKVKVGGDCSANSGNAANCPTDAPCASDKCECTAPLVKDPATGLCKLKVEGDCSTGGANPDKCATGSTCVGDKCVCTAPLVKDPTSELCKVKADGDCSGANVDKCVTGTTCTNDKCACPSSQVANKTSGLCTAKAVVPSNPNDDKTVPPTATQATTPKAGELFGACQTTGDECSDANAECDTSTNTHFCKCKKEFYAKGSSCTKAAAGQVGGSCTDDKNCTANDKLAICDKNNKICKCPDNYQGDPETGCAQESKLGGACDARGKCADGENTECHKRGNGNACLCSPHYHIDNKKCVKTNSGSAALTSVTSLALVALFWASRHLLKE